ncbi:hypothetical protein EMIHUDRAFT_120113 [Emiliania huxleyi CCMP1516]|uniref:Uncharacterized protein n=2 Tax=Emiliania huxleyi TaxID=2903 RepID=A0A0D3IML1_EMIH1|nr:hypothetical protein EMIHUDRAFT_120113 [Emiliania huxleyi CCMP1516]EOD12496.1 hypothetical protein EMIHUDRAFT_120113 [Emiliania huxleyi CCMP1516]|eukprot:XP_005764925.1 hypothetical protein EMIHUDRAFT_120113 [Emiliania huxleyi CCMP1516]
MEPPCREQRRPPTEPSSSRASGGEASHSTVDLPALIASCNPSVAIFDLDSTLWNGNCESFDAARVVAPGEASDTAGRTLRLFPEVSAVFEALSRARVPIGIASASPAAATATRLLQGFRLDYGHAVVQPGSKSTHLKAIAAALKVDLRRALFFDDLPHNIRTADAVGVGAAVQVARSSGVTLDDVRRALRRCRERGKQRGLMARCLAALYIGVCDTSQPLSITKGGNNFCTCAYNYFCGASVGRYISPPCYCGPPELAKAACICCLPAEDRCGAMTFMGQHTAHAASIGPGTLYWKAPPTVTEEESYLSIYGPWTRISPRFLFSCCERVPIRGLEGGDPNRFGTVCEAHWE